MIRSEDSTAHPTRTDSDRSTSHGEGAGAEGGSGQGRSGSQEGRGQGAGRAERPRYFSTPGVDPPDELSWELRSAVINGEHGKVVFEQKDVEVPKTWSQMATNVVASKYFRGTLGTPERESSVQQLIGRVVDTITGWGAEDGYFAEPRRTGRPSTPS